MDGSLGHYAKRSKLDKDKYHIISHMYNLKTSSYTHRTDWWLLETGVGEMRERGVKVHTYICKLKKCRKFKSVP